MKQRLVHLCVGFSVVLLSRVTPLHAEDASEEQPASPSSSHFQDAPRTERAKPVAVTADESKEKQEGEKKDDLSSFLSVRDPFKKLSTTKMVDEEKSVLEALPVTDFKMVGILTGPVKTKAMIKTPDGQTFFVSERMKLGQRNGTITRVGIDYLLVRERTKNVLGQDEVIETRLNLEPEEKRSSKLDDERGDQMRVLKERESK